MDSKKIPLTSDMISTELDDVEVSKLISDDGYWFPGWDNFPASAYIDLGGKYIIHKITFSDLEGVGDFRFEVGQPAGDWLTVWEGTTDGREVQEKETLAETRYLRLVLEEAGAHINNLQLFGEETEIAKETHEFQLVKDGELVKSMMVSEGIKFSFKKVLVKPKTVKPPNPIIEPTDTGSSKKTLDNFVQTNVLLDDPHDLVAPVSAGARGYQYLKWLQKDVSNEDVNKPLSQVKINFDPIDAFSMNLDEQVRRFAELGDFYLTLFESAMYQTGNDKTWLNAVAYKRSDGRSGLDNPERWKYISHLYFQVAARYGQTKVDDSKLITDSPKRSGLGYCKYIEGGNEKDRWWIGRDKADLSPEEHAAYYSAVYDGHMNTMSESGAYFGVKNADPNIKLMLGGLAFVDFDELLRTGKVNWFERFFGWFEEHRTDERYETYPIDVICYHDYPNTERKQRNLAGKGLEPETYKWYEKTKAFVEYIGKRCPKPLEVDNNEFGYDRNQSSPQRAEPYAGFSSEQVAGFWTIRLMLEGWAAGLTRGVQFYFRDNNSNGGGIFQSSGLTDKSQGYKPFQMYYYLATMRLAMKGHEFVSRTVIGDMIKYETKHRETGKKGYVLWHFTKSDKKTSYSLEVSSSSAVVTRLQDNSLMGAKDSKKASNGRVVVLVSELPTFVTEE